MSVKSEGKSEEKSAANSAPPDAVNEVRLVGRVSAPPERRALPSGDEVVSFRVIVRRPESAYRGTQRVDVLECVVWGGRAKRTVEGWRADDVVEVSGAIRRRFFRSGSGAASRIDVEVRTARLIRRSANA